MTVVEGYMSLLQPLLTNKDFYNLSTDEATNWQSDEKYVIIGPGMVMLVASGYLYDIYGRKIILFISFFFCGVSMIGYPLSAPSKTWFLVSTCFFFTFMSPIGDNPLIMDYVCKESRGRAISIGIMGVSLGIVLSLNVIFKYTVEINPLISWGIMGVILCAFAISLLFIVQEPKNFKENERR